MLGGWRGKCSYTFMTPADCWVRAQGVQQSVDMRKESKKKKKSLLLMFCSLWSVGSILEVTGWLLRWPGWLSIFAFLSQTACVWGKEYFPSSASCAILTVLINSDISALCWLALFPLFSPFNKLHYELQAFLKLILGFCLCILQVLPFAKWTNWWCCKASVQLYLNTPLRGCDKSVAWSEKGKRLK